MARRHGPELIPFPPVTLKDSTKTKFWFLGAGVLALLALYCFSGAVMNGSFAVGGGTTAARAFS